MSHSSSLGTLSKLTGSDLKKDEEILMNQIREREAAIREEAEAREREAELARQRLEQEQLAREEEERRQAEREKALEKKKGIGRGMPRTADPSSSGVRGVRGTRATMRARGVATGIARGRRDTSFNAQGSAHAFKRCFKVPPPLRVLEKPVSLGLRPRHRLGRVRSRHAAAGVPDPTCWYPVGRPQVL